MQSNNLEGCLTLKNVSQAFLLAGTEKQTGRLFYSKKCIASILVCRNRETNWKVVLL